MDVMTCLFYSESTKENSQRAGQYGLAESIRRVEQITGASIPFYKVDIRDRAGLSSVLDQHSIDCCIHFAGLKAVGESVVMPLEYYENNINGTSRLCSCAASI